MHETPSRDRGDGRAIGPPQGLGLGRFKTREPPASACAKRGGAGGRVVCGAKRIRSHYLPSPTERPPGLSTRPPPKGPASLSTINGATMRLCRADHPCLTPPIRGWPVPGPSRGSRSPSVPPRRVYSSERRTAISAVVAGGSCMMRGGKITPIGNRGWQIIWSSRPKLRTAFGTCLADSGGLPYEAIFTLKPDTRSAEGRYS